MKLKTIATIAILLAPSTVFSGGLDYAPVPEPVVVPELQCLGANLLWKVIHGCYSQNNYMEMQEDRDDRKQVEKVGPVREEPEPESNICEGI